MAKRPFPQYGSPALGKAQVPVSWLDPRRSPRMNDPDKRAEISIASVSRLGSERHAELGVRLQPRAADEIDAIMHRCIVRVEAGAARSRLAWKIVDEARAARASDLAGQNGGRHLGEVFQAHEFAE